MTVMSPETITVLALGVSQELNLRRIAAASRGDQRAALRARAKAVVTFDRVLTHWSHAPTSRNFPSENKS